MGNITSNRLGAVGTDHFGISPQESLGEDFRWKAPKILALNGF
jgi:hypothetical protein